jgi:putative transposase
MDISRELGINKQTFYNWKKKYAGMSGEHLRQLKQLQEENQRLKQMCTSPLIDWRKN